MVAVIRVCDTFNFVPVELRLQMNVTNQFHFEIGEICTIQMGLTDSYPFVSGLKYKHQ